jgi:hypothetical protein
MLFFIILSSCCEYNDMELLKGHKGSDSTQGTVGVTTITSHVPLPNKPIVQRGYLKTL